jgi:hypothetical protein
MLRSSLAAPPFAVACGHDDVTHASQARKCRQAHVRIERHDRHTHSMVEDRA